MQNLDHEDGVGGQAHTPKKSLVGKLDTATKMVGKPGTREKDAGRQTLKGDVGL